MANTETKIVLILNQAANGRLFSYYGKSGRQYRFLSDGRGNHVCVIPLSDWRANKMAMAKDLLDQPLQIPILFDVLDGATPDALEIDKHPEFICLAESNAKLAEEVERLRAEGEAKDKLLEASKQRIAELSAAGRSEETSTAEPVQQEPQEPTLDLPEAQSSDGDQPDFKQKRTRRKSAE